MIRFWRLACAYLTDAAWQPRKPSELGPPGFEPGTKGL
jgi:hypothetical protein